MKRLKGNEKTNFSKMLLRMALFFTQTLTVISNDGNI